MFLSTYTNKVDKKGRVSVPARYRAILSGESFNGVILFPSFVGPAIEACGMAFMERLQADLGEFDPFSEAHDDLALAIMSDSHELSWDSEGRILLPPVLLGHAGISDAATFVGAGERFQIWQPAAAEARKRETRARAQQHRGLLRRRPETPS